MIEKLVSAAVRAPFLVLMAALALVGVGIHSYMQLDIEAYPNPVAPMIEVIAQPQGWSVTSPCLSKPGWWACRGWTTCARSRSSAWPM